MSRPPTGAGRTGGFLLAPASVPERDSDVLAGGGDRSAQARKGGRRGEAAGGVGGVAGRVRYRLPRLDGGAVDEAAPQAARGGRGVPGRQEYAGSPGGG